MDSGGGRDYGSLRSPQAGYFNRADTLNFSSGIVCRIDVPLEATSQYFFNDLNGTVRLLAPSTERYFPAERLSDR
jgi:hypothetical protein